jgi:hypothetical protein
MLNEELIKQIFFQSDRPRKDALIADEVDIMQFAEKLIAVARIDIMRAEHERCVQIVSDMNREVGNALANQRPK